MMGQISLNNLLHLLIWVTVILYMAGFVLELAHRLVLRNTASGIFKVYGYRPCFSAIFTLGNYFETSYMHS